tara:strand:+ start:153 stop:1214 length:1062 start_codon:yes stop_codon:yes gene_type:complete
MIQKIIATTIFIFTLLAVSITQAQEKKKYKINTIAFYNVENLFDTINDPNKNDEASPIMNLKSNLGEVYKKKIQNMAMVIAKIGAEESENSPAIIGLSEVENKLVVEDLARDPSLISKGYEIIHFDSPDERGIDVALMYQKALFTLSSSSTHELKLTDKKKGTRDYTRDQLLVSGYLEGDLIHVIVNHWPSRSGGEEKSRSKREAAARLNKQLIDSLQSNDPYAKIFSLGDFNDNPGDNSIKKILKAKEDIKLVEFKGIYNPLEATYKTGVGTNSYKGIWFLFDQILISKPLLNNDYSSFKFYRASIFNPPFLINKQGPYKGFPFRSFTYRDGFIGGFSDHLPVYVQLIKEVD